MVWVFGGALLFGGVFVLLGLLGKDSHPHVDGDLGHHELGDAGLLAVFSLRNLTWASFAFGGIGLLATLTNRSTATTWLASVAAGVGTLALVHVTFRALRRGEVGIMAGDVLVVGASASLVLPFDDQGMGVVQFVAGGQVQEIPARRAAAYADLGSEFFANCRIESIQNGLAIVEPATS